MTVQDLIDELRRFDPHMKCVIDGKDIDYVFRTEIPLYSKITKSVVEITSARPHSGGIRLKEFDEIAQWLESQYA
jgi:hypothetical protein